MNNNSPLILIGAGKMGSALLEGWLTQGIPPEQLIIVEQDPLQANRLSVKHPKMQVALSLTSLVLPSIPQAVVLAVKPQQMDTTLLGCKEWAEKGVLFLSIAAGKTTAFFQRHLGEKVAIIRAMPNLPATIAEGATVLYATPNVTEEQRRIAGQMFQAVGQYAFINDEALIDAVTALSGSGPAYVFLLAECMIEAGKQLGLPPFMADSLARQTILGSARMLAQSEEPAGLLRSHVTSPGGTTEAALRILMGEDGMEPLLARAMQAAADRSHELAE